MSQMPTKWLSAKRRRAQQLSPLYATELLNQLDVYEHELSIFLQRSNSKEEDLAPLLSAAVQAAATLAEALVIMEFGRDTLLSIRKREQLRRESKIRNAARQKQAALRHQNWIDESAKVWGNKPELRTSECSHIVISRLKIKDSPGTVRRVIARYRPRKKT